MKNGEGIKRKMNSTIYLMKKKTERIWIEENKKIHVFNYWFYRWFTNSYRDFLLLNFRWEYGELGGGKND